MIRISIRQAAVVSHWEAIAPAREQWEAGQSACLVLETCPVLGRFPPVSFQTVQLGFRTIPPVLSLTFLLDTGCNARVLAQYERCVRGLARLPQRCDLRPDFYQPSSLQPPPHIDTRTSGTTVNTNNYSYRESQARARAGPGLKPGQEQRHGKNYRNMT